MRKAESSNPSRFASVAAPGAVFFCALESGTLLSSKALYIDIDFRKKMLNPVSSAK